MSRRALAAIALAVVASACKAPGSGAPKPDFVPGPPPGVVVGSFEVSSAAFAANGTIPKTYTCEASGVAPPLAWTGAPASTQTFALVVEDPDAPDPSAPTQIFVHWVLYDLPAFVQAIAEGTKSAGPLGGKRRHERLRPHGVGRSLPARRPPPLRLPGLRARRGAAGPRPSHEGRAAPRDGRSRPRDGRARRDLPKGKLSFENFSARRT